MRRRPAVAFRAPYGLKEGQEIPAREELPRQAGGLRGFDVASLVADKEASPLLNGPMSEEIEDHAGLGFPPVVLRPIRGDAAVRVVRAVAPVVDRRACRSEFLRHPAVKSDNLLPP